MDIYIIFSSMLVLNLHFALDIPGVLSNVLTFVGIVVGALGLIQNSKQIHKFDRSHHKLRMQHRLRKQHRYRMQRHRKAMVKRRKKQKKKSASPQAVTQNPLT